MKKDAKSDLNIRARRKPTLLQQTFTALSATRSPEELVDVHRRLEEVGGFTVRAEKCENCLFTPDRLTTCADAVDIITATRKKESFFGCHRYTDFDAPAETNGGRYSPTVVCCRAYFDLVGHDSVQARMAAAMGIIRFVDDDGHVVEEPDESTTKP